MSDYRYCPHCGADWYNVGFTKMVWKAVTSSTFYYKGNPGKTFNITDRYEMEIQCSECGEKTTTNQVMLRDIIEGAKYENKYGRSERS